MSVYVQLVAVRSRRIYSSLMLNERPATRSGRLALEDGTIVRGRAFGAINEAASTGEVVFNTAMCGYQEALTDPSYAGQILIMTATMVGNYGVSEDDVESGRIHATGLVIRELSPVVSNHRATRTLWAWLASEHIIGLEGVDTRAIVRHLREKGAMRGVIAAGDSASDVDLVAQAANSPGMAGLELASSVTVGATQDWSERLGPWGPDATATDARFRVVALDCGGKRNIYRHLASRGCALTVVPMTTTADEVRALAPDGVFVSNGPGDPAAVGRIVETLKAILPEYPTFGICMGHQLIARALGATTYKLKFGHRGANQPVRNDLTGIVEITSQNHGFCVDPSVIASAGCVVTHTHLNDGTLAGFAHSTWPVFAVQYHPEASPGPHDSSYLFDCFIDLMRTRQPVSASMMSDIQRRGATAPTI